MKHIISLSGGIGSYIALKRIVEKHGSENVVAVFCDTLVEDNDLYRFLEDIVNKFSIGIIRLVDGRKPFELCYQHKFLFNSRVAKCSAELKSKPFNEWLKKTYEPNECVLYFGIDFTESHRCNAIVRNYDPYKVEFPLLDEPLLYKNEMLKQLQDDGIEVPRMYKLNFAHNNCGGICFKAGIGHFRNLYLKDKEKYIEAETEEENVREFLGKDVSILKRNDGVFTLRQLRELLEGSEQYERLNIFELEVGGCGCFVDEE
jgi:hypothetical protein